VHCRVIYPGFQGAQNTVNFATESAQYLPIAILIVLGLGLCISIFFSSQWLGPRVPHPKKDMPFECGVPAYKDANRRFSVRFYLVAILFLLFDVEVIFLFPWAIVFKDFLKVNTFILWEMAFFVAVLLLGYFYIRQKGALEWE
jgi:NADH-quinone oxidoreductase subunit A